MSVTSRWPGRPAAALSMYFALKISYSNYMSSLLQIRGVPDEARGLLKARAAIRGQSLNAYLLEIIEREISRPTVAEVLQRAAQRAERSGAPAVDALAEARAAREEELNPGGRG